MFLLAVSHYRQRQQADCLAACAADGAGVFSSAVYLYERLLRLLNIRYYGAAFSSLRKLESLGVAATIARGET